MIYVTIEQLRRVNCLDISNPDMKKVSNILAISVPLQQLRGIRIEGIENKVIIKRDRDWRD